MEPEFLTDLTQNLINLSLTKMMLQIKFDCNWPAGCRDMFESVNRRTDTLTDGRRLESHPINSPCEPSVELKCGTRRSEIY